MLLVGITCVVFSLFFAQPKHTTITINGQHFSVELAQTPNQLERGLGGRSSIGSDGMLFVLPRRTIPGFWMKDMQFALDFIWIDDGKIVDITENVQPPKRGIFTEQLVIYRPHIPVTYVLVVPARFVDDHQLKVGESIQF